MYIYIYTYVYTYLESLWSNSDRFWPWLGFNLLRFGGFMLTGNELHEELYRQGCFQTAGVSEHQHGAFFGENDDKAMILLHMINHWDFGGVPDFSDNPKLFKRKRCETFWLSTTSLTKPWAGCGKRMPSCVRRLWSSRRCEQHET